MVSTAQTAHWVGVALPSAGASPASSAPPPIVTRIYAQACFDMLILSPPAAPSRLAGARGGSRCLAASSRNAIMGPAARVITGSHSPTGKKVLDGPNHRLDGRDHTSNQPAC